MRLQVEADKLKDAVRLASLAVGRSDIAIFNCLHLSAKDGSLRVVGARKEMEAQARVDAAVSAPGAVNVDGAALRSVVSGMSGVISLALESGYLILTDRNSKTQLSENAGFFPRIEKPEAQKEVEGLGEASASLLQFLGDEGSPEFQRGVLLSNTSAVAYSGSRFCALPVTGGAGQVIPGAALKMIAQRIKGGARLFVGDRHWRVEAEDFGMAGPLMDVSWPDWQRIVPASGIEVVCDANDLASACEVASLGRARDLHLFSDGATISLTGERFETFPAQSTSRLTCDGAALEVVLNAADLRACLKPFAGSVVSLTYDGRAFAIRPEGKPGALTMTSVMRDARNTVWEDAA